MIAVFPDSIRSEDDETLVEFSPLVRRLLVDRGITSVEEARIFLEPIYNKGLHDPFLLLGMEQAVKRIYTAIKSNEKITVYSDYDCDGIPGAVVLHDLFAQIGYSNISFYIPDRHKEGYGLHHEAITEIVSSGTTLLITIDLGSTDVDEVAFANLHGVDVIITDHHLLPEILPEAYAIINPKQSSPVYPDPMLCGSGVAFKVVQAFLERHREEFSVPVGWEKWLLDMVGFATLADMVPLVNENRIFAYFGMKVISQTRRPGLRALLQLSRLDVKTLTEDDLTFMIAPRINAASRMEHPKLAFELLIERDPVIAMQKAKYLEKLNSERKTTTATVLKKVKSKIETHLDKDVLVVGDRNFSVGILGLVASRLVEEYKRPVFVWGSHDSTTIKGSCRSDGTINVVELMRSLPEGVLIDCGGHEGAGGFSVSLNKIHTLESSIVDAHTDAPKKTITSHEEIVCTTELTLSDIKKQTWETIQTFAPFGVGNPKPVFFWRGVTVSSVKTFGKAKEHLELVVQDDVRTNVKAIAFFSTEATFGIKLEQGMRLNIIGTLERSLFGRKEEYRIRLLAISS